VLQYFNRQASELKVENQQNNTGSLRIDSKYNQEEQDLTRNISSSQWIKKISSKVGGHCSRRGLQAQKSGDLEFRILEVS
jgi:hypothetical protein